MKDKLFNPEKKSKMENNDLGSDIMKLINALFVLLLIPQASGAPDEAIGAVVNDIDSGIDGDSFNISLYKRGNLIFENEIRVRLADIDCPEASGPKACRAGREAANYTQKWLEGKNVSLDLDDRAGQDLYGRWIAICYLNGSNFNKQIVDAGYAEIQDHKDNEFDPMCWWTGYYMGNKETKVYHSPGCTWAGTIEQGNLDFFSSPEGAISEGYRPCTKCHPPVT